jgi:hypothetical protein
MKTDYVFSFYGQTKRKTIKHPKWWQVWKKAELVEKTYWCRRHVCLTLNDKQKELLPTTITDEGSLLYKMTFANWSEVILNVTKNESNKPKMMQLEHGGDTI